MESVWFEKIGELLLGLPLKEFFVGVFGALLGGWFTLKGAKKSHELESSRAQVDQIEKTKKAIMLIRIEITSAWDVFYSEYGKEILNEEHGVPHIAVLPIGEENFVVYESLLAEVSLIDSSVAEKIVRIYSRARGLVENVKYNNSEAEQCIKAASDYIEKVDLDLRSLAGRGTAEDVKQELYSDKAYEMARIIGMGGTSQAVRELAGEIKNMLEELIPAIEGVVIQLDGEVKSIRKKYRIS